MTKGKLVTTPSRMLKLILPVAAGTKDQADPEAAPLALLIHPQQPLSYLERLIQSELPVVRDSSGNERVPAVTFLAEDSSANESSGTARAAAKRRTADEPQNPDTMIIDGEAVKTGVIRSSKSGAGAPAREAPKPDRSNDDSGFVRWSGSTEIGDFIRDATRSGEFGVAMEGAPRAVRVAVPSFVDRTFYLRMRLRKKARHIARLADIKRACDAEAERGAKRVALAGGAALVVWWALVFELTFRSELGWNVMEPVTYLVGLSTLIAGYAWFLIHNRQVSYRSAMNFTISRRQSQLYAQRGFDPKKWEDLIDEGNKLRREIKAIAEEYDVEWEEKEDETSEKVMEVLKKEAKKKEQKTKGDKEDGED